MKQAANVISRCHEHRNLLLVALRCQLNMLQCVFEHSCHVGQGGESHRSRAARQRMGQRDCGVRQRLMQFQSPFLQTGDQTTRPLVRFIQVHVVQRQANTQGFNDLDRLFAHRFFFGWRLQCSLWLSRLNLHRVGNDRRHVDHGFSQNNWLRDQERCLFKLTFGWRCILFRLSSGAEVQSRHLIQRWQFFEHSMLFRLWCLFHHRSSRHVCIQERKVRQTQIDGAVRSRFRSRVLHRQGFCRGHRWLRLSESRGELRKIDLFCNGAAHGLRGRGVRHNTRFSLPFGNFRGLEVLMRHLLRDVDCFGQFDRSLSG